MPKSKRPCARAALRLTLRPWLYLALPSSDLHGSTAAVCEKWLVHRLVVKTVTTLCRKGGKEASVGEVSIVSFPER